MLNLRNNKVIEREAVKLARLAGRPDPLARNVISGLAKLEDARRWRWNIQTAANLRRRQRAQAQCFQKALALGFAALALDRH
ncbi:MAG: hypothetical protein PHD19_03805 [Dechloromonas sp.]|nr:hypothetical protein [Dechloromonas sp.]